MNFIYTGTFLCRLGCLLELNKLQQVWWSFERLTPCFVIVPVALLLLRRALLISNGH